MHARLLATRGQSVTHKCGKRKTTSCSSNMSCRATNMQHALPQPWQQQHRPLHRQQQQHHISYTQAPLQRHTAAASSTWQQRPLQSIKTETLTKMLLTKRPQQQQQQQQHSASTATCQHDFSCFFIIVLLRHFCVPAALRNQSTPATAAAAASSIQQHAGGAGNKSLAKMCAL